MNEVVFIIEKLPPEVDAEQLRAAVARELGVSVTLADKPERGKGTLVLHTVEERHVLLSYRAADGRVTERDIDLPERSDRAAEVVALLAGNIVRDEAAELEAAMRKKNEKPPPAPPAAPPPAPIPVPPAEKPSIAPPGKRASPTESAPRCGLGQAKRLFGADLLPFLGSSTFDRNAVRHFSLNGLGGYAAGLDGFELGGLVNIESKFTCGFQGAGTVNVTRGPVRGAQLAGLANFSYSLDGGAASLVNIATEDVRGAQMGLVDVAIGDVHGAQIGLVNVTGGKVRGAQFGLVNVADASTFSFGLVSIVRKGRLHVGLSGQESGLLSLELKNGGDFFHQIYEVGVHPRGPRARIAFAMGFGTHLRLSDRAFVDIDLLGYSLHDPSSFVSATALGQQRVLVGARLVRSLAVYAGPTYDVAVSWSGTRDAGLSPYGVNFTYRTANGAVQGWPGVVVGVQVH